MTSKERAHLQAYVDRGRVSINDEEFQALLDNLPSLLADADRCETLEREVVITKALLSGSEHDRRVAEAALTASRAETAALRAQVKECARIARFAINGWACYAKRKIELDDIHKMHGELDLALAPTPPAQPQPEETP